MGKAKTSKHPQAGKQMTGAETVIEVLHQEGVDTIFGYSGGAILPTYDAIFQYNEKHRKSKSGKDQIRLIVPANEQGAGFMAAGYARATGKVGCFLVTSGPGATNAVTPIRDSMADSVPVVMISGQVPRGAIGTDAFQEAPIFSIMNSCAKHVFLVQKPEELEATVRTAFDIARSGRPGPVVIDIPKDVQISSMTYSGEGLLPMRGYLRRREVMHSATISKTEADAFFEMLERSERPLIYAGGGVINANAADELRKFSKKYGIPVVTTLMGIGAMDVTDPLSLHMLGMHGTAYANYAVEDCDFLIAVGARFDDRVAGKVSEFAPMVENIAHIDVDASEVGKVKAVTWSFVGHADKGLSGLLRHGARFKKDYSDWQKHIQRLKKKYALNYDRKSERIQPHYVMECLNDITGGDAIITVGVGQHQMWAAQYGLFREPRTWLTSGSMGTMGFGLPAAIGAQFACPDKLVVNIDGDGSIRMNFGDLETVTNYQLPVKVLLLNNQGDGMVRQWQRTYYGHRFSGTDKTLHAKDFVLAAKADGYPFAERVKEKGELKPMLKKFIQSKGAAFLDVWIDQDADVMPMVGPGSGYKEMITGPFIPSRDYAKLEAEKNKDKTNLDILPEYF